MTRNRLYTLLGIACLAGYSWLLLVYFFRERMGAFTLCPIKALSGYPCPSCGSTRGVLSIAREDFASAIHLNPVSYIVAATMLILPIWLIHDAIRKSDSLHRAYIGGSAWLGKKQNLIIFVVLILINWIWNILKQH